MTPFERRGIAVITRSLLVDVVSPDKQVGGITLGVNKEGGKRLSAYFVHKISFSDIEIEDKGQNYGNKIYSTFTGKNPQFKLANEERPYYETRIEEITPTYLRGTHNLVQFEARLVSSYKVEIRDNEFGKYFMYEVVNA